MKVNNPRYNDPVEQVNQEIYNILVTKDIDKKVFEYIYPWGETLVYIALERRVSYHNTIGATPGQYVFGRDMIFNLVSVIDWIFITAKKQKQVNIDNVCENDKQVSHYYTVGDIVYLDMTGIYQKLDYNKYGLCRTTEAFTNGIVQFQKGQ